MNLHQGKFTLDIRERFFTKKVVRIPRGGVMAPSHSESKECMDSALGHVV